MPRPSARTVNTGSLCLRTPKPSRYEEGIATRGLYMEWESPGLVWGLFWDMAQAFWGLKPKSQFRPLGHILPMTSYHPTLSFLPKREKRRDLRHLWGVKLSVFLGRGWSETFLVGMCCFLMKIHWNSWSLPGDSPSTHTHTLSVDASTNWGNFKEIDSSYIRWN